MAFTFTPSEPIKNCQFSYMNFLDHVIENSNFISLPFIVEWKRFWGLKLQKEDEAIKEYIKQHPHTNPLLMRAKQFPGQFNVRNEIYQYAYRSNHGENFYFHFDIEKIKKSAQGYPKLTLNKADFYIDPDTEYGENNMDDRRLPFFTRMFTIDKPYILIDGNKRVMAKIDKGFASFQGYEVPPDMVMQSFFTSLEMWFYTLLYETKLFSILMLEGKTNDEIKSCSNAFR